MVSEINVRDRIRLKQLIDRELDALYPQASKLGKRMGSKFATEAKSQLRNLETVAGAATRTSALKNHIKNQVGKDRQKNQDNAKRPWACEGEGGSIGEQMMKILDDLAGHAAGIVMKLGLPGSDEDKRELARIVEIELQRGLVQTAVCAALYRDAEERP